MNRIFLIKTRSKLFIKIITSLVIVREIKSNKYKTSKYIIALIYFLGENVITILISRKIYIVNNLKINILIEIDIIILKKINILVS